MGLPSLPLRRETLDLDGQSVEVRGLSRAEALIARDRSSESVAAMETYVLSVVFDVSVEDAQAWHADADQQHVGLILDAVARLSGLDEATGKASAGA